MTSFRDFPHLTGLERAKNARDLSTKASGTTTTQKVNKNDDDDDE
jgi:hypothetical protein